MGYWNHKEPDNLFYKGTSIFRGSFHWEELPEDSSIRATEVIKAFINDNELVEITVTSACLGFTYTIQKRPRDESANDKESKQVPISGTSP